VCYNHEMSSKNNERLVTKDILRDELQPINMRLGNMESKLCTIESKFGNLDSRLDAMDSKFGNLELKFVNLGSKFGNLELNFERMLGVALENFQDILTLHAETTAMRFDATKREMQEQGIWLSGHEDRITVIETKLT